MLLLQTKDRNGDGPCFLFLSFFVLARWAWKVGGELVLECSALWCVSLKDV